MPRPSPRLSSGPAVGAPVVPAAPLRADARRNLSRILDAAAAAFAEAGADVPMEEIARRAGVGVGTLYRRFPDREALVLAVARNSLRVVHEVNHAALEAPGDAWERLVAAMTPSAELTLTLRLAAVLSPEMAQQLRDDPEFQQIQAEMLRDVETLVEAAQSEGRLRSDVGTGDVVHLFSMLLRSIASGPADVQYERAQAIVLDGLRAPGVSRLPGREVSAADRAL